MLWAPNNCSQAEGGGVVKPWVPWRSSSQPAEPTGGKHGLRRHGAWGGSACFLSSGMVDTCSPCQWPERRCGRPGLTCCVAWLMGMVEACQGDSHGTAKEAISAGSSLPGRVRADPPDNPNFALSTTSAALCGRGQHKQSSGAVRCSEGTVVDAIIKSVLTSSCLAWRRPKPCSDCPVYCIGPERNTPYPSLQHAT